MKSKRQCILAAVTLLLLAGCSNNNEVATPDSNARVALQVNGGILTRAAGNKWNAGDAIGIYMVKHGTTTISEGAENRLYSTTDGSSTFSSSKETTIYFSKDGGLVDFLAYYPYRETLTEGALTLNVSDQTNLSAIDLMSAKVQSTPEKPMDKNHPQVALNFTHMLTKLELNIATGNGMSTDELKGLKVEITNQRTEGSFDPLYEAHEVLDTPAKTVALNTNADGTQAQAILLPTTAAGDINPIIRGRELIFTLAGNKVFKWSVPDEKSFERGDRNIYNITINRTSLAVTATITDWNNGNGSGDDASAE